MKPEKITAEMLIEKRGKCESDEVDTFRSEWPDGAEVTLENLNRAIELGLSIEWFVENFVSGPAKEAYRKAEAPAMEAFQDVLDTAQDALEEATASAKEAYAKAVTAGRLAYLKAIVSPIYKAWQMTE